MKIIKIMSLDNMYIIYDSRICLEHSNSEQSLSLDCNQMRTNIVMQILVLWKLHQEDQIGVQGHPGLHCELQAQRGYIVIPCFLKLPKKIWNILSTMNTKHVKICGSH